MAERKTLLLTQGQVRQALSMADAVSAVEDVFREYGEGRVAMPPKPYLFFEKGDLRCMPAYVPALGLATVKNVNVHPENTDLPTVMGTVSVFDPETGFPLAIMDGTYLTAARTGAAGGVAAKYLSRGDSEVAGCVGAGRQAETQLAALLVVRPGVRRVLVSDVNAVRAEAFVKHCEDAHGLQARACSIDETVREADVLITVTPVRKPVVRAEWVRPGTHINAIGADAPGKQELETAMLKRATVVVDNWEQASHGGEINVALKEGALSRQDIYADIGQIVTGRRPARRSAEEITVFDSTGLAIQDCACAALVYRYWTAPGRQERSKAVDFLREV